METILSIIIPVYNLEKYISRCLDSITKQLPNDGSIQVYVIDDGSTDLSASIIQKYKNIHYIYKENGGVSSARNLGLDMVNSKYVTFIDGDDWVSDNYISVILENLKDGPELLCFNWYQTYDDKNDIYGKLVNNKYLLNKGDGVYGFLNFKYQKTIHPFIWNKVYNLDIIRQYSCKFDTNKKFAEDMLFNADYMECISTYRTIDNSLYYYYQREGSVIHSYKPYFVDDTIEFIRIYTYIAKKHNINLNEQDLYTFYLSRYFGIINNEGKNQKFKYGYNKILKYLNYNDFKNKKIKILSFKNLDLKCKAYLTCICTHLTYLIYFFVYLRYKLDRTA